MMKQQGMAPLKIKMLKAMVEKLQRGLSLPSRMEVPKDVKEGHLAVHATNGKVLQRFIVGLKYLACPEFLQLLEQAEEEFGFKQNGVLIIPCHPDDLKRILGD